MNLIDYLPAYLQEIYEFKEITDTEQIEITEIKTAIIERYKDFSVFTLTEYGICRWEQILGIVSRLTDTLEERRYRIITKILAQQPYTYRRLQELLTTLCGSDGYIINLTANVYTLEVKVAVIAKNNYQDVVDLVKFIVPANLDVTVIQMYNRYEQLEEFTHQELSSYTHYELRNEVIE